MWFFICDSKVGCCKYQSWTFWLFEQHKMNPCHLPKWCMCVELGSSKLLNCLQLRLGQTQCCFSLAGVKTCLTCLNWQFLLTCLLTTLWLANTYMSRLALCEFLEDSAMHQCVEKESHKVVKGAKPGQQPSTPVPSDSDTGESSSRGAWRKAVVQFVSLPSFVCPYVHGSAGLDSSSHDNSGLHA